jgi:hypothetical protein
VDNLLIVEILKPLQDLLGVVGDGALVLLEWTPLGAKEGREGAARNLLHDDLEVARLREGAQVLHNVPKQLRILYKRGPHLERRRAEREPRYCTMFLKNKNVLHNVL